MSSIDEASLARKRSDAPLTTEGERPQKKFYRQRAHCNPLSHNDTLEYPVRPADMDWTRDHYPRLDPSAAVPTVLDVGCGFGGLSMALAPLLPGEVVLGLEIRAKVAEYVRLRIAHARQEQDTHHNCSVLRTNSMKVLPHYFAARSVRKLFFCFPDPHFKRANHPRRIITDRLLAQYAYLLAPDVGRLYCITDVKELHDWHVRHCDAHPLFRRLLVVDGDESEGDDSEAAAVRQAMEAADPCLRAMQTATEESQKVDRNGGRKYYAVYQRIPDAEAPRVTTRNFFGSAGVAST